MAGKSPLAVLLLLTVLGTTLVFVPAPVHASLGCGSTITTNTTLSADIGPCPGDGLFMGASSITLDCAGHTITGSLDSDAGINITGVSGVTVKNCNVTGFGNYGFYLATSTHGNTLVNNAANADGFGFLLDFDSNNNVLTGNTANGDGVSGFVLFYSHHNTLDGNTADGSPQNGILLDASTHNRLDSNTADGNHQLGIYLIDSTHNKLTSNIADSNFLYGYGDNIVSTNRYSHNECSLNGAGGSAPGGLGAPQF